LIASSRKHRRYDRLFDYSTIDVLELARKLLGEEKLDRSTKTEKHFPENGGLFVNIEKNRWHSHGNGKGGDAVELVCFHHQCDRAAAFRWLRENGYAPVPTARPAATIVAEYDYLDENGARLYQVVRYAPKNFRQRRQNGSGWVWKGPESAVPYRLPELVTSSALGAPVLIAGGEKDVDNLRALGFTATCNHGGEGKWWPELTPHFEDRRVFILCDNDHQGEKHQQVVGAALSGIAKEIRVVRFPDLPAGGDVSDLIAKGATRADIVTRLRQAPEWEPAEKITMETESVWFSTPTGGAERPIILIETASARDEGRTRAHQRECRFLQSRWSTRPAGHRRGRRK
jgi:putative DNA primase/helicase